MDGLSNSFGLGGGTGTATSAQKKEAFMNSVRSEQAMQQARTLIDKLSETCYDRCILKPGTTLASADEKCLSACMEKYMNAWNVVSRQYIARVQKGDPIG